MNIVALNNDNRSAVDQYIKDEWGGLTIVTLGNAYNANILPGYVMMHEGTIAGAILYRLDGKACEIAVLYSLMENQGIGSALIREVISLADKNGCERVWLVTSNDNTHAIRFYQKFGFALKAVHINSFDLIRKFKPHLPERGIDQIPLAHEFEFEWKLK